MPLERKGDIFGKQTHEVFITVLFLAFEPGFTNILDNSLAVV